MASNATPLVWVVSIMGELNIMNHANDIFEMFDLFFAVGSIAAAGFFYFLYTIMKEKQSQFKHSTTHEGVVIELNGRVYPVVEYEIDGRIVQFTSRISAPGVKIGQKIDLELSPNRVARIKSNGHTVIQAGLRLTSIAFFVAGCIFLYKRFV